jgi:nitrate reductase gamma subunit
MHVLYSLVAGPLAWAAFILFFGGILLRLIHLVLLVNKSEKFIFSYMSLKYSLRSIAHWLVPFATVNWRKHPLLTVVTFAFHLCLLITPIFLLSHVVLWDEAWSLSWWTLPDAVADAMTVVVMAGSLYFLVRRLTRAEVQFVTDWTDYLLLAVVAAPFVTGFIASI